MQELVFDEKGKPNGSAPFERKNLRKRIRNLVWTSHRIASNTGGVLQKEKIIRPLFRQKPPSGGER